MTRTLHTEVKSGERLVATDITDLTFFPKGTILTFSNEAWNATSDKFKNIWKICNAANHTANSFIPDLTNKFLRGDVASGPGTGCADSQTITLQTKHMPKHNHTFTGNKTTGHIVQDSAMAGNCDGSTFTNSGGSYGGLPGSNSGGGRKISFSLTPTGSISETGGGSASSGYGEAFTVTTLPNYYAVIFIIKVV
jgi:hypothetical protein